MATTVAFSELDTWLQSQPANTASTPYELNITGLTEDDVKRSGTNGTVGYILIQNNTKYVDLSETNLPRVSNIYYTFQDCTSLVNAPVIPDSVTDMDYTFSGCTSLVNAPVIPDSVTSMRNTFSGCTSLVNAPVIPDSITSLYSTFSGCTSLTTFRVKSFDSSNITEYVFVFRDCNNLTEFYCDTPYNLKTWLDTIHTATFNNFPNDVSNCHFYLYSELAEISINNLSEELSALSPNTTSTPYKIKIVDLTISDSTGIFYIREKLRANPTKYVDLSATPFPSDDTIRDNFSLYGAFKDCTTLIKSPSIVPEVDYIKVKDLEVCYSGCTNLIEAPVIPKTVTRMIGTFENCSSLQTVEVPESVISLYSAFKGCVSLTSFSIKSFNASGIVSYTQVFNSCTNLVNFYCDTPYDLKYWLSSLSASDFPNSVSNCHFYLFSESVEMSILYSEFSNNLATLDANTVQTPFKIKVTDLRVQDVGSSAQGGSSGTLGSILLANPTKYVDLSETVMPNATDLTSTFENCVTLVDTPDLPNTVTVLDSTYKGCTNLTEAPAIPNVVTEMPNTFTGCLYIESVDNIPSGVTDLTECFKNCSALVEIELFDVPLSVLKTNAQDCFDGCTSLTSIGVQGVDPITEAEQWHAMKLNFGADNVSGKVYDKDKNTTTIPQTAIQKGTLTLPVKTDELWFPPSNMSDADVDEVIESVIDSKRTYFNKNVLNPLNKSFVLWKDSQSQFVSNIDFGGSGSSITVYDTLQELEDDLPNHNVGDVLAVDSDYFIDKERILDDIITLAHDEILNILKEAVSVPIGTILSIPSSSVVAGYLQCNGSTFDELDYPFLYSALRTNRLPKKWNAEEWVINQEILTEETFFGKPVYSFSFYDDRTRTNSWAVCMPNGETYFPYEHNIKRIISVECSSSHNTTYRNGTVGTHIYQITNTVLDSTTQEYIPSATSQLFIYYGNQNYWSATDRVLRTIYYTKIEDDETRFRWKYIKAISGVEEEESATVVNAIQVAEECLEQTVRDTADSIMAAAIDNYFKEYVLAEATVTPTSGTQAVNANTVFNDSLLNYRTIRFYMKRSTGSTDYIPHYEVTHEEMVNICARNTNYSLMIPGYASEYRQMTFNAGGTVCTAVAGSECCYKVIGIGKLN